MHMCKNTVKHKLSSFLSPGKSHKIVGKCDSGICGPAFGVLEGLLEMGVWIPPYALNQNMAPLHIQQAAQVILLYLKV